MWQSEVCEASESAEREEAAAAVRAAAAQGDVDTVMLGNETGLLITVDAVREAMAQCREKQEEEKARSEPGGELYEWMMEVVPWHVS